MSVGSLLPLSQLAKRALRRIKTYAASARSLPKLLLDHDMPDDVGKVTSEHIRAFLLAERERTSPVFAQHHHRNLHACFRWIETEGSGWNPTHGQGGETLGSRAGETLLHRSRDYSPAAGLHRPGLRV